MKGARRWAIAGLLCLCGAFGCAQLPSRGLFVRRDQPPAAEPQAEQQFDSSDAGSHGPLGITDEDRELLAEFLRDRDSATDRNAERQETNLSLIERTPDSSDGHVSVSNLNSPDANPLMVEAPSPQRRSSSPPGIFVASPDARAIIADLKPTDELDAQQNSVTFANHETTNLDASSSVELVVEQRQANSSGGPNLWDRFRGLTNRVDTSVSKTSHAPDLAVPSEQPRLDEIAPNNLTNGSVSAMTSPELWPRSPANLKSEPSASTAPAPANVPWPSSEQFGSSNAPLPAVNPLSFVPTDNVPANFGSPEGVPMSIGSFPSSPELERLITQTTVEAAAVIPGENDFSRQLYLRKQVQLRLLYLMAGQTDRAIQPIPGIDPADQEFWQQLTWGMANYFDTQGMPDSAERATQTINQIRAAAARLQEKARLELHNVAFCHKITGFGNYHRFKRDEFTSGQPVLLYAEVADFKSELLPDGQFRTLMKSTLEVIEGGPTGRLIESLPLAPSEDLCRNRRRDYYYSYEFAIPQGCNPGPHTLRLRVEDQLGKKTAITTLNFMVQ